MNLDLELWKKYALTEDVDEVVLSPLAAKTLKLIARESCGPNMPQQLGFLEGIVQGRKYYAAHTHLLAVGREGSVDVRQMHWSNSDSLTRLTQRNLPYRTLIFHSHPQLTEETLRKNYPAEAEAILELTRQEIALGVFDYLGTRGRAPTVDAALTETFTRELSPEDKEHTPGKYHLLVTHNVDRRYALNHLNLYSITQAADDSRVVKSDVNLSLAKPADLRVFREFKREYRLVIDAHNREVFGTTDFENMTDEQRQRAILIVDGLIGPKEIFPDYEGQRLGLYKGPKLSSNQPLPL
jgi:hypothetical protein